jgi:hypothetical protein
VTTSTSTTAEPAPGAPPAPSLSLLSRLLGVIHSPTPTFAAVAANPRWLGVLVLTLGISTACIVAFLQTEVGRQAFVDQTIRSIEAYGSEVSDAQFAAIERMSGRGAVFTAVGTPVGGVLIVALLAGLAIGIFNFGLDGRASYRQAFAVVAHAGVILTLRTLFATPLNYASESLASPTSLGVFVPMLDEASVVARFLSLIDLFVVWWVIVLAIGVSVLYRRPVRPIALAFLGIYVVFAVVQAGIMLATGGAE